MRRRRRHPVGRRLRGPRLTPRGGCALRARRLSRDGRGLGPGVRRRAGRDAGRQGCVGRPGRGRALTRSTAHPCQGVPTCTVSCTVSVHVNMELPVVLAARQSERPTLVCMWDKFARASASPQSGSHEEETASCTHTPNRAHSRDQYCNCSSAAQVLQHAFALHSCARGAVDAVATSVITASSFEAVP